MGLCHHRAFKICNIRPWRLKTMISSLNRLRDRYIDVGRLRILGGGGGGGARIRLLGGGGQGGGQIPSRHMSSY